MPGSTATISVAAAAAADPGNSTTTNNAATGGDTHHTAGNSTKSSSMTKGSVKTTGAAAVSATKKNNDNTHRYHDDNTDNCSVYSSSTHATMATESPLSDCLCWALYCPKFNNNKGGTMIRKRNKGILWPALRFSSIRDFLSAKGDSFDELISSSNDAKKMKKKKRKLAKRVMKESFHGRAIHTILFLGRPVDEYVTADESEKKGVKVQDYTNGLASFSGRRKRPDFIQKFISLCDSSCGGDDDDNRGEATAAAAFDLFQDFYKALDEAVAINRTDDDNDDSSQDDSDDDDDDVDVAWASKAQKDWDEYQSRGGGNGSGNGVAVSSASKSSLSSQNNDEDVDDEDAVVAVADAAFAAPNYPQQEQQEQEEYHHNNEHQGEEVGEEEDYEQQDEISCAQSTAAVSLYTEASTTSAASTSRSGNMGGHHQQQHQTPVKESPPPSHPPSKLSNVNKRDDFDTCWNNHEMEGWEQFEDKGQIVYRAPNGYMFNSHQCFCEYLTKTYGWVDPNAKQQASRSSRALRGRSSSRTNNDNNNNISNNNCLTERQRSYSPDAKKRWSTLWNYLTHTLDWTYNYATVNDAKVHGASTIWFRPDRNFKDRGELGKDHFFKEDDVVAYCDKNNISPPPPSPASLIETKKKVAVQYPNGTKISKIFDGTWYNGKVRSYNCKKGFYRIRYDDGEKEDFDDADVKKWLKVDDDDEMEDVDVDESGYDTPDDQSTVPQDPGKPRLPSPSEATNASSSSGDSNGSSSLYGLSASYCDEDRYDFKILWKHLKEKGWYWMRAKKSI